jgi:uncharacterized protein (TIGR02145 family)/uncharacterized repeat protein (TIGR02543 family)
LFGGEKRWINNDNVLTFCMGDCMKKTILYIATAATLAAVSVIAIIGCNDGGANAGRVSEEVNAFLNKFDNAVPATVTPPDTSSGIVTYKLITNVSTPDGGSVSRNPDKADYGFGEPVRVTAAPAEGYEFKGWSGAASGMANPVMVTMNGNQALTAEFREKTRFTVTFNRNNSYGTDQPPAAEADSGADITLPAMANIHSPSSDVKPVDNTYIFIGWSTYSGGTGPEYSAGSYYTVTGDVTLYAKWRTESTTTPEACVVLYDGNGNTGGTGYPPPLCLHNCGFQPKPLFGQGDLVKTGYDFGGWSNDPSGEGTIYQPGDSACGMLYAVWKMKTYKLTVSASPSNGGTVSVIPDWAIYSHGEQVTVTAKANTGYNFTGWTGASSSKDNSVTIIMDDNKTLTAGFGKPDAKKFAVAFDSNGGGNNPPTTSADSGSSITLPDQGTMQKNGYSFGGWNTSPGGTGTAYSANFSYPVTRDITLFAKWTPVNYKITYTLNSGSVTSANPESYTIETASFTLNNPTRTGYTFTGWTGSNGAMAQTSVTVAKGTTGELNYIANWTLVTYTVTFNANGGSVTPASGVTGDGGKLTSLPVPTRDGYTFGGWFTTSAATGGTQVTESTVFSANATVYARWTLIDYKITYSLNGATTTPSNPASYTIETASFILNPPSRTCYTFAGWTGSNGTTPQTSVTVPQGSTGDKSYVANWNAITYTLTTNVTPAGGGTVSRNPNQTAPYSCGSSVTVTAMPASGYVFTGWSGVAAGTANPVSVTVNSEMTVTANFELVRGTLTDSRNSRTYNTVKIGNQWWMAENLNYAVDSSWCYDNNNSNCATYGRLYKWSAAMNISASYDRSLWGGSDVNRQGVCPAGWHLPSRAEWGDLAIAAGGTGTYGTGGTAGRKLKTTTGWYYSSDSYYVTDEFGFSALPGGYRLSVGFFDDAGNYGYWWTATEDGGSYAYGRFMYYNYDNVVEYYDGKEFGFAVRCVRD